MTIPHREPELNYIVVTGRVTEMGELKYTSFGTFVIHFKLENMVTQLQSGDEEKLRKYLLDVEAWGNLAERIDRSIEKGMFVMLEGSLVSRSYEDRLKRLQHRIAIKASDVTALGT